MQKDLYDQLDLLTGTLEEGIHLTLKACEEAMRDHDPIKQYLAQGPMYRSMLDVMDQSIGVLKMIALSLSGYKKDFYIASIEDYEHLDPLDRIENVHVLLNLKEGIKEA